MRTLHGEAKALVPKGEHEPSRALREVLVRCLQREPHRRPSAARLLETKFFRVRCMLRGGGAQCSLPLGGVAVGCVDVCRCESACV